MHLHENQEIEREEKFTYLRNIKEDGNSKMYICKRKK